MRIKLLTLSLVSVLIWAGYRRGPTTLPSPESARASTLDFDTTGSMSRRPPACFVPNLGQWPHAARFVRRAGPMTVFLEDHGWILDLKESSQKKHGVALRMSFVGAGLRPGLVGEDRLPGHDNYFLGSDESRWRTHVPRYASVRYAEVYPGIDVRLHQRGGHLEYDVLCDTFADLSEVIIAVEGADGLTLQADGSLVIDTSVGPIRQPVPSTFECLADGGRRPVPCAYVLLGDDRFGFVAADWDRARPLVIDPGLLWSTYLGGSNSDLFPVVAVDARGIATVAGSTDSKDFPTTIGAYDTTNPIGSDIFISRLDPRKVGAGQLLYSTYLGSSMAADYCTAISVDGNGVVTVLGQSSNTGYPTTRGAYRTTYTGGNGHDVVISRLDPNKSGASQLVYSTYLGGRGPDGASALGIDPQGVVTLAGWTESSDYPTTRGAFRTRRTRSRSDAFVSRLDLRKTGAAQLVYSTFLGGNSSDQILVLETDARGVITVAGETWSSNFPTTAGAYDAIYGGNFTQDLFVSRLDPGLVGAAQLVYSTYLGGWGGETPSGLSLDADGVVTVGGSTWSPDFPATKDAFDTTNNQTDTFLSRLDPRKTGAAQLLYSTFLGGTKNDGPGGFAVDCRGVVTVVGTTFSTDYPVTGDGYDTSHNGNGDVFVSRLDPKRKGAAQLVYSTYLGGSSSEFGRTVAVDASGVATVAGWTWSRDYPTTAGAFDTTLDKFVRTDIFVSRLDMGVALSADVHELSLKQTGSQKLALHAGKRHANRRYWIVGSASGTGPGVTLAGVHVPINPDVYTDWAMAKPNSSIFVGFKGVLDANGRATASLRVPSGLPPLLGFTLHHAFVVYDATARVYMASNAVPIRFVN